VRELADYIGIPYQDKGRDPAQGLDCWGLVRWFYENEKGIELPSYTDRASGGTDRHGVAAVVLEEISRKWHPTRQPEEGDAVVLRVGGRPFHVGVFLAGNRLLHTLNQHGSVIEPLDGPKWAPRIEGYYRYG
jgi:cell wall-associated NlpC family hydrolase